MSLLCKYLHRVPSELVQEDDIFRLVKSTCDVLNEETERLPFFFRGHPWGLVGTADGEQGLKTGQLRG